MSVRLGFLSGRRPSRRPSDPRDGVGDDVVTVMVVALVGFYGLCWMVGQYNRGRRTFRELEAAERLRELADREDREVAYLDAMFDLPAAQPWRRWVS